MIIGENRAQVIENIKAAVKKGKMHAKVELGDPILTKDERIKLVNDYWKQQKKLSHKFKNIIAQNQAHIIIPDKISADSKGLCDSFRLVLNGILNV